MCIATRHCNISISTVKINGRNTMSPKLRLVWVNLKFSTLKGKQIGPYRTFKLFPRNRPIPHPPPRPCRQTFFEIGTPNSEHISRIHFNQLQPAIIAPLVPRALYSFARLRRVTYILRALYYYRLCFESTCRFSLYHFFPPKIV